MARKFRMAGNGEFPLKASLMMMEIAEPWSEYSVFSSISRHFGDDDGIVRLDFRLSIEYDSRKRGAFAELPMSRFHFYIHADCCTCRCPV
jgi:hypothetical protein